MGCFDFTYADNGENIRGRNGYIYLTSRLATRAKLNNPLKFDRTDEYGHFRCISGRFDFEIDIYALLALELYLEGTDLSRYQASADRPPVKPYAETLLTLLEDRTWNKQENSFTRETAIDKLRDYGIDYHYDKRYRVIHPPIEQRVAKLGGQKEKAVTVTETYSHPVPLVISRKKLHIDGEPSEIADEWCFVTGDDPEQGFAKTKNLYYAYERTTQN